MIDTQRKCNTDFTIHSPDGGTMVIPKGEDFFVFNAVGEKYFPCEKTFTEEEMSHLNKILNKFDDVSVMRFTIILTELCQQAIRVSALPNGAPSIVDKEVTDLLAACKKMKKKLDAVCKLKQPLHSDKSLGISHYVDDITGMIHTSHTRDPKVSDWESQGILKAAAARSVLSDFIRHLDSKPTAINKKIGRPKADSSGFVKEITKAYSFCFGKRAKMHSDILTGIVQFALEAIGRDDTKDPARKIQHALLKT